MAVSRINEAGLNVNQYGNRNLIINGAMQVAQRGTSATVSEGSNEGYSTVDRFYLNFNNAVGGAIDMSQSTDAPDGFSNSVKLQCSTTNTTFTTTMNVGLQQRIEAQNLQQLAYGTSSAKQMTISWYMKAVNFTGPISLSLETRDGTNEYYVKSYTPTTSWARYTCTVPGSTSATINNDNGQGFILQFVVAGSSSGTYAAASDSTAWSTTRADYRNDIGNFTSSTSNELYITGVQLEVGDTATDFEHRSYGDELAKCRRYYEVTAAASASDPVIIGSGMWYNSSAAYVTTFYSNKRTDPTITSPTVTSGYRFYFGNNFKTVNSIAFQRQKPDNARVSAGSSGATQGDGSWGEMVETGAKIEIDAEL